MSNSAPQSACGRSERNATIHSQKTDGRDGMVESLLWRGFVPPLSMQDQPKQYFGYIRVSTLKQGEGVSLQEQKAAIERYALEHQLHIGEWFEETVTAAKLGRPAFTAMLRKLRAGKAAGVVVHKIDRSARNLKDWAQVGELIDLGIEMHFCHEALDLSTRGGRLSADIQAVVAADFIRNLREETRKGFYGRLKQGLYPLGAPLGYVDNGKGKPKTIDLQKGPLVRSAFELYATGRYTLKALQADLYGRGLRNRNNGAVTINGLSKMLRNPFYAGIIRLATTGETFQGVHEPIVPPVLFKEVQVTLAGRAKHKIRVHDFLYRRLLTCGVCGKPLIGERQKGHVYYRCHNRDGHRTSVRSEAVDNAIGKTLRPVQLADWEFNEFNAELDRQLLDYGTIRQDAEQALELNVRRCRDRLDRLTDVYVDGQLDAEIFKERRETLLIELSGFEQKLSRTNVDTDRLRQAGTEFLEQARSAHSTYVMAVPHEQREFLKTASSNRTVSGKKIEIELRTPYLELANRPRFTSSDLERDSFRTIVAGYVRELIKLFG